MLVPAMAVNHYENFPVASVLMPAQLRPAVRAIYAFARSADDIADEGDWPPAHRLQRLAEYAADLDRIEAGMAPRDPVLQPLLEVIARHRLPITPFRDLLDAFRQDVTVKHYASAALVHDYCRRSANPVGRIMLALWQRDTPATVGWSDAICTALQRINFLQDIAVDAQIGRIYLPLDRLDAHGITPQDVLALRVGQRQPMPTDLRRLVLAECADTRRLMLDGRALPRRLGGRIGLELQLVMAGGLRILDKIEAQAGEVARTRPVLQRADWPLLLWNGWVRGLPRS